MRALTTHTFAGLHHGNSTANTGAASCTARAQNWLHLLTHKKHWLRINRTLAWAMVVSPALQILLGSRLVPGLLLDLAILLVHGGLSAWLFGAPKAHLAANANWMYWMGASEPHMSPRNRFLLSGWRVLLSTSYQLAVPLVAMVCISLVSLGPVLSQIVASVIALPVGLAATAASIFFGCMLPYAIVTHLFGASRCATRRWGLSDGLSDGLAAAISAMVVVIFIVSSVVNLFRPLWS